MASSLEANHVLKTSSQSSVVIIYRTYFPLPFFFGRARSVPENSCGRGTFPEAAPLRVRHCPHPPQSSDRCCPCIDSLCRFITIFFLLPILMFTLCCVREAGCRVFSLLLCLHKSILRNCTINSEIFVLNTGKIYHTHIPQRNASFQHCYSHTYVNNSGFISIFLSR